MIENLREFTAKKRRKRAVQNKIKGLLDSESWKIVEMELKNNLKEEYASFLNVSPKDLKNRQYKFNVGKALINSIYTLAGLEWKWDGYKDLREEVPENADEMREHQLLEAHLETLKEEV